MQGTIAPLDYAPLVARYSSSRPDTLALARRSARGRGSWLLLTLTRATAHAMSETARRSRSPPLRVDARGKAGCPRRRARARCAALPRCSRRASYLPCCDVICALSRR
eukprot:6201925-Pleurochrysis_carterae.AAC.6